MTINERIKHIRKEKGLNQKQFASLLGVTQSGVSYMEQTGSNISDSIIKSICVMYNLSENWLRTGTGNMYIESSKFNLNDFITSKGATELDLDVVKAYFELDSEIRHTVVEHFKRYLGNPHALYEDVPESPKTLEEKFTPIDKTNDTAASDVG